MLLPLQPVAPGAPDADGAAPSGEEQETGNKEDGTEAGDVEKAAGIETEDKSGEESADEKYADTACAASGDVCHTSRCCKDSDMSCFAKDDKWASCMAECQPGTHDEDGADFRTEWSCKVLQPGDDEQVEEPKKEASPEEQGESDEAKAAPAAPEVPEAPAAPEVPAVPAALEVAALPVP